MERAGIERCWNKRRDNSRGDPARDGVIILEYVDHFSCHPDIHYKISPVIRTATRL